MIVTESRCDARIQEIAMDAQSELIPYNEAIRISGLSRRTWYERIKEAGIVVYQDGRDRRQRLIDVRDLPKLTAIEPVVKRAQTAA